MQLTLIARLEDLLHVKADLAPGYSLRAMEDGDNQRLADLYFASYGREVVADESAALHEIEISYGGEYGELDLQASPVIVCDGQLVGSVMTVHQAPWSDTPFGPFVIEVMVHPAHRRKGLARSGIVAAAGALAARRRETVALRVMSDNIAARALYEKLTFTPWVGEASE